MYKEEQKTCVAHGVSTCSGCGLELTMRTVMNVMGDNTVVIIPPGCAALFSGFGKETAMRIPGFQGNLENTAAYASGVRTGLDSQGKQDVNVLAFAGDGATVDIGLQSLSGMLERGERVIYVCYDNEAYMNTGGQRSGSTPLGAETTTTQQGKCTPKKDMLSIVAAHKIPYAASASVADIEDLKKKIEKAKAMNGPAYIHVHAPCPTGWGYDPSLTIEIARKAVHSGLWELFEVIDGEKISKDVVINENAEDYFRMQKRYKKLGDKK